MGETVKVQFGLTQEEIVKIEAAIFSVTDSEFSKSFNSLVNDYSLLVRSLDGYAFSIYDYDNDLSSRVILSRALSKCSPELQVKVASGLQSLDVEFEELTRVVERGFNDVETEDDVWYSRIPIRPGIELQRDIDSGNL